MVASPGFGVYYEDLEFGPVITKQPQKIMESNPPVK